MLVPSLQRQMSMVGGTYCLKEPGQDFYCQEQRARLHLENQSCYNDFKLVDAGSDTTCHSSPELSCCGREV